MNVIFCFWTGDNEMSHQRATCLEELKRVSECTVVLVTKKNLNEFLLPNHPLHPAYQYLSETHKADYLRTYFMNFIGGGYSDIKKTSGSWTEHFERLKTSKKWICGYKEIGPNGVPYTPLAENWEDLIGNGSYICKPHTPLTALWYKNMLSFLDDKLEILKKNPSHNPQDCSEKNSGYPIGWSEMLGVIFHQVVFKYKNYVDNSLPILHLQNYR